MQNPGHGRQKLLEEIDRLLAEAPDEASRRDLERLRESLNSPELRDVAQAIDKTPRGREPRELVLNFHAPAHPMALTAAGCVVFAAIAVYAASLAWTNPVALIAGRSVQLWLIAAGAGALSALFTALSFRRSYFVRFDTEGMAGTPLGKRWRHLRAGALRWKDIRSLHERADRVLEIHSASGVAVEVPMKLVNYPVLKAHLENMVLLYGDAAPRPPAT